MSESTATRESNEPSYEERLGDGLEKLLGNGVDDLEGLASGLNLLGIKMAHGQPWTSESLDAELKRLGED